MARADQRHLWWSDALSLTPVRFILSGLVLILTVGCNSCAADPPEVSDDPKAEVAPQVVPAADLETFFDKPLDAAQWAQWTHQVDAGKSAVEIGPKGLTVSLETYGRAARDVSVVALAWRRGYDLLQGPLAIEMTLDWLEKHNANYLSAGIALVPEEAPLSGDPRDLPAVAHLSFIGAGIGANARRELVVQRHGNTIFRDTEGWPEKDADGRALETARVRWVVGPEGMTVTEEGRPAVKTETALSVARVRVVLFVVSHSNSMKRALRFARLAVK